MTNYSRRNFIKFNSAVAASTLLVPSAWGACTSQRAENNAAIDKTLQGTVGKNLKGLRDWYANELYNRFVPNMDQYVVDHEYGGFMCTVDIASGELLSTNKRVWYEGRGLWTYSFLYNNLLKDEKILQVAKKSVDFILKHRPEKGKFWPSSFTREGEVLGAAGDGNPWISSSGDIYGGLFMAEGLAEYAKASGDRQYYDLAKSIMQDCLEIYDNPEYSFRITYLSPESPVIVGARILGHWMVLLRGATQMLEYSPGDAEVEKIADRCVEAIMTHHMNDEYQLLNEGLNHDFSLPDNEYSQFSYTGHGIETLWMVMFEADRRKDKALLDRSIEAFKRHIAVAKDSVYGGYFRALDHVGNNTWKTDKVLWLQEEILIGTLFMMEKTGDKWAEKCFAETYKYVSEKFARPEYKFWVSGADRKVEKFPTNRAEHYHHPRHLMLNLLALNRLVGTGD